MRKFLLEDCAYDVHCVKHFLYLYEIDCYDNCAKIEDLKELFKDYEIDVLDYDFRKIDKYDEDLEWIGVATLVQYGEYYNCDIVAHRDKNNKLCPMIEFDTLG